MCHIVVSGKKYNRSEIMPRITEVQLKSKYRLKLKFSDGTEGELDLSDKVGKGVYTNWTDKDVFESVQITNAGDISWPNDVDMCADSLYLKVTGKSSEAILDFPVSKKKSA
jgi:hypothetical protein